VTSRGNLLDFFGPPKDEEAEDVAARRLSPPPQLKARRGSVKRGSVRRGSRRRTSRRAGGHEAALATLAVVRETLAVCDDWVADSHAPRIYKRLREACEAVHKAARAGNLSDLVFSRASAAAFAAQRAATAAVDLFRLPVSSAAISNVRDYVAAARKKLMAAEHAYSSAAVAAPSRRVPTVGAMREELRGLPMEARLAELFATRREEVEAVGEPPKHPPELIDDEVTGWVRLLRFVPRIVGRLGISAQVRDGSLADHWLGSGAFAAAFELPDPTYVLKLTTDPEDAYVAMKLAEANTALPGLIRTYTVFRIPLPFKIETRIGGPVDTLYGMVTERVLTLEDYNNGVQETFLIDKAAEALHADADKAHQLFEQTREAALDFLGDVNEEMSVEKVLTRRAEDRVSQIDRDFRFGVAWCNANGVLFGADAHLGNFAIAWRGDRFMCVKSDLGYNSVTSGRDYASAQAAQLPLAANRRPRKD